jgi:hypothetical protein
MQFNSLISDGDNQDPIGGKNTSQTLNGDLKQAAVFYQTQHLFRL